MKGKHIALELEMRLFTAKTEQPLRCSSTVPRQRSIQEVSAADAEFCPPRIHSPVSAKQNCWFNFCNCLSVLQEISLMMVAWQHNEYENEKLFFSTLGSVHTISDCILRKFRGLLMVVSSDCIKLDLLEGEDIMSSGNKSTGKLGVGNRKGKGKSRNLRKLSPKPKSRGATSAQEKPHEVVSVIEFSLSFFLYKKLQARENVHFNFVIGYFQGRGSELASKDTQHSFSASIPQGEDNQSLVGVWMVTLDCFA